MGCGEGGAGDMGPESFKKNILLQTNHFLRTSTFFPDSLREFTTVCGRETKTVCGNE